MRQLVGVVIALGFGALLLWVLRKGAQAERQRSKPATDKPEQGFVGPVLIAMSEVDAEYWTSVMWEHANGRYGCRKCRVRDCAAWAEARNLLAWAGRIDYDPLRDQAQA